MTIEIHRFVIFKAFFQALGLTLKLKRRIYDATKQGPLLEQTHLKKKRVL